MREQDILHENNGYWVGRERDAFTVFVTGATHSVSDSAYAKTDDGLRIAIARCDYLAKTATPETTARRFANLSRNR